MEHGTPPDDGRLQRQVMDSAGHHRFDVLAQDAYGYHRRQVDRFMRRARAAYEGQGGLPSAEVRRTVFDAVKGGYAPDQVDDALDRLEDALAHREREQRIASEGEQAWASRVSGSVEILRGRLERPEGQRFRRPSRGGSASYDVGDVDALCRRLLGRLEHRENLGADDVRRAVFSAAAGPEGYEEAQVDAFLDAAIDVLSILD